MKLKGIISTVASAALLLSGLVVVAPTTTASTVADPITSQEWNNRFIAGLNQERAKAGLAPVAFSEKVSVGSREHSRLMTEVTGQAHASRDQVSKDLNALGCTGDNWAELINVANPTPEKALFEFMSSTSHRDALLTPKFRGIGFGNILDKPGTLYETVRLVSACKGEEYPGELVLHNKEAISDTLVQIYATKFSTTAHNKNYNIDVVYPTGERNTLHFGSGVGGGSHRVVNQAPRYNGTYTLQFLGDAGWDAPASQSFTIANTPSSLATSASAFTVPTGSSVDIPYTLTPGEGGRQVKVDMSTDGGKTWASVASATAPNAYDASGKVSVPGRSVAGEVTYRLTAPASKFAAQAVSAQTVKVVYTTTKAATTASVVGSAVRQVEYGNPATFTVNVNPALGRTWRLMDGSKTVTTGTFSTNGNNNIVIPATTPSVKTYSLVVPDSAQADGVTLSDLRVRTLPVNSTLTWGANVSTKYGQEWRNGLLSPKINAPGEHNIAGNWELHVNNVVTATGAVTASGSFNGLTTAVNAVNPAAGTSTLRLAYTPAADTLTKDTVTRTLTVTKHTTSLTISGWIKTELPQGKKMYGTVTVSSAYPGVVPVAIQKSVDGGRTWTTARTLSLTPGKGQDWEIAESSPEGIQWRMVAGETPGSTPTTSDVIVTATLEEMVANPPVTKHTTSLTISGWIKTELPQGKKMYGTVTVSSAYPGVIPVAIQKSVDGGRTWTTARTLSLTPGKGQDWEIAESSPEGIHWRMVAGETPGSTPTTSDVIVTATLEEMVANPPVAPKPVTATVKGWTTNTVSLVPNKTTKVAVTLSHPGALQTYNAATKKWGNSQTLKAGKTTLTLKSGTKAGSNPKYRVVIAAKAGKNTAVTTSAKTIKAVLAKPTISGWKTKQTVQVGKKYAVTLNLSHPGTLQTYNTKTKKWTKTQSLKAGKTKVSFKAGSKKGVNPKYRVVIGAKSGQNSALTSSTLTITTAVAKPKMTGWGGTLAVLPAKSATVKVTLSHKGTLQTYNTKSKKWVKVKNVPKGTSKVTLKSAKKAGATTKYRIVISAVKNKQTGATKTMNTVAKTKSSASGLTSTKVKAGKQKTFTVSMSRAGTLQTYNTKTKKWTNVTKVAKGKSKVKIKAPAKKGQKAQYRLVVKQTGTSMAFTSKKVTITAS